jgi:hypothetical protein
MPLTGEFHNRFLGGESLAGLKFRHNQSVRVTRGVHIGKSGCIVSVEETSPEPLYFVELDWTDGEILMAESGLRSADADPDVEV